MLALAASRPHYWRPLLPLARFGGLPTVPLGCPSGAAEISPARASGFVTASFADSIAVARFGKPVALCEHGAGQSYVDSTNGSYAGGTGRDHVGLFLCQTHDVARRNGRRSVVVGYPALEHLDVRVVPGRIGITWHWDCRVSREAGTAFHEYRHVLPPVIEALRRRGWDVVGHAHPRIETRIRPWWAAVGVPWVGYEDLLACEVVVVDNSTAGCEAMWLGRRVVWLSSESWRRDVWHGRRFWEWPRHCFEVRSPSGIRALPEMVEAPWDPAPAIAAARASLGEVEGATRRTLEALEDWRRSWH